ncbi:hypothetical protein ACFWIB_15115 [Streptomyces sp. NPDC127051]|uniref:hypothetical protein n=1 Tax=Streptomyces sp. NPDC127051 TaxID=3347119 RepID=UPI00364A1EBC
MHEMPDPEPPRPTLSRTQRTRVTAATRTLASSRIADLATLDAAAAILMIEGLRSSLDDTVQLIGELIERP